MSMVLLLKYFISQVDIPAILILSMILLFDISSSQKKIACYEAPASKDVKFAVEYSENIPFIPERLFVRLETFGEDIQQKMSHVKVWHVEITAGSCYHLGVHLPFIRRKEDEELTYILTFFSDDDKYVKIEEFIFILLGASSHGYFPLKSQDETASIMVQVSKDSKWLLHRDIQDMRFFKSQGKIDVTRNVCLKLFEWGKDIVIEIKGQYLQDQEMANQYYFDIIVHDTVANKEFKRRWLAKPHYCNLGEGLNPIKIYIQDEIYSEKSPKRIRISIHDPSGQKILQQQIIINDKESKFTTPVNTMKIETVRIVPEKVSKALSNKDGLLMYQADKIKFQCVKDSKSFVDLHVIDNVIIDKSSRLRNSDYLPQYGVIFMDPTTNMAVVQCLGLN